MNRNSLGLLGACLLVVMYTISVPAGRVSPSPSSALGQTSKATKQTGSSNIVASKEDFGSEIAGVLCGSSNNGCLRGGGAESGPQFVIATLPDPVRTQLGLFFDRMVDTIQQAAQDQGYLYQSSALPWDDTQYPQSTKLSERLEAEEYQERREQWPGVLTFRNAAGRRLIVFVVGEFPTGGIHPGQLEKALTLVETFAGRMPPELLILGPTFSGSLQSLPGLLSPNSGVVTAFSGTVSSFEAMDSLRRQRPGWLTFASFQQNDQYTIQEVLQFALGIGYQAKDLALLSEDGTAYGRFSSMKDAEGVLRLYFPREISQLRSAYQTVLGSGQTGSTRLPQVTLPLDLESAGANQDSVRPYASKQLALSQEAVLLGIVAELRAHRSKFVLLRATDALDEVFLARYLRTAFPQVRILTMGSDLLFARELEDSRLHGILTVSAYPAIPGLADEFSSGHSIDRIFPSGFSAGTYNAFRALLQPHGAGGIPLLLPSATKLYNYGIPDSVSRKVIGDVPFQAPPIYITALGHNGFWPLDVLHPVVLPRSTLPLIASKLEIRDSSQRCPTEWQIFQAVVICLVLAFLTILVMASLTVADATISQFARFKEDPRSGAIAVLGIDALALLQLAAWPYLAPGFYPSGWQFGLLLFLELLSVALILVVSKDLYYRGKKSEGVRRRWVAVFGSAALIILAGIPATVVGKGYRASEFVYRSIHLTSGVSPVLPVLLLITSGIWWSWYTVSGTALIKDRRTQLFSLPRLSIAASKQEKPVELTRAAAAGRGTSGVVARVQTATVETRDASTQDAHKAKARAAAPETAPSGEDAQQFMVLFRLSQAGNKEIDRWMAPGIVDWRIHPPLLILMVACALIFGVKHALLSFEHWSYNTLVEILVMISVATMIASALHLRGLWLHTKRLLTSLDSLPLRRGFKRAHWTSSQSIWHLGGSDVREYQRALSREREAFLVAANNGVVSLKAELEKAISDLSAAFGKTREQGRSSSLISRAVSAWRALIAWFKTGEGDTDRNLMQGVEKIQKIFADAVLEALLYLEPKWGGESVLLSENGEAYEQLEKNYSHFWSKPVEAAEGFVCMHYINYILIAAMRIRSLITAISGLYVITLLALCAYPFEPALVIKSLMTVLLLFLVAVVAAVYAGMHRDATVSYITQTEPGELGRGFWVHMASFLGLPLLGLVAAQFPELSNTLFSWIGPALQAAR